MLINNFTISYDVSQKQYGKFNRKCLFCVIDPFGRFNMDIFLIKDTSMSIILKISDDK